MNFECNGTEWTIKVVDEDVMNNLMKNDSTLGATVFRTQEIYLLEDQANIIKTLKHELTHAWLYEYGYSCHEENYSVEDICEIVASNNNFVNEVVKAFNRERNKSI